MHLLRHAGDGLDNGDRLLDQRVGVAIHIRVRREVEGHVGEVGGDGALRVVQINGQEVHPKGRYILAPGDRLVVDGGQRLSPGASVLVVQADGKATAAAASDRGRGGDAAAAAP